jgi:multidrug transporter EmrE-like cation transporter
MNILISIPAVVWLLVSALFFGIGEYLSKVWAQKPSLVLSFWAVLVYVLGAVTWLPVLFHKNELSTMGTLWLLLGLLATVSIGILVFHESLNYYQIAGVVLAVIAVILINL